VNDETKARVASALGGVIEDGERFLVSCKNGVVDVDTAGGERPLVETEPELYGHLMTLNQELSSTGAGLTLFFLIGSVVLSMSIGLGWLDMLGVPAGWLQSWWVYLLIVLLGFMVGGALADGKSNGVFARAYSGLISMSARAGLNRFTLLARIKDDKDLSELAKYLAKKDAGRGDR
jgi:hypothetical protein